MLCVETEQDRSTDCQIAFVELSFRIIGETLPADHGYGLYSAITHICPAIHAQKWIGISTVSGEPDRQGKIHLFQGSQLRIRLPYEADKIAHILPLAGQQLKIGNHVIELQIPQIFPLKPYDRLRSRLVTIKKFQEPEPFIEAVNRQMAAMNVRGNVSIPLDLSGQPSRKAIKIKKYSIVGFSLSIDDLSDEDSIKLQSYGLGGKRRMGCGIFSYLPGAGRF
jgi:CRISPR-associated protein Cas6